MNTVLYPDLQAVISQFSPENLSLERKQLLDRIVEYVRTTHANAQAAQLNFICTHNSRRSHLAQVWAQTMAAHYGVQNVYCYSGGTARTALFPMIAATLRDSGFQVMRLSEGDNPVYAIKYGTDAPPVIGFSKPWDDAFNPTQDFAAIMTCASADADCPFIPGAKARIATTYEDPKVSDGTDAQVATYRERSDQIATEMAYVFQKLAA